MIRQDEIVGTLGFDTTERPCVWTKAQVDLAVTIANHAALVIDNARLYNEAKEQLQRLTDTQAQLLQAGKPAAVGQLIARVADELNNPLSVEQVMLNLLLNAEQALAGVTGERRICLQLVPTDNAVQLIVSDTGYGIAPEHLPRIFEPFFTMKPVGQGTGLGLSISYGIVQAHNGRIWAESERGRGTTITVELPCEVASTFSDRPSPSDPPRGSVLVIDDEAEVADMLREMLEALHHDVTVAIGGQSGWEHLTAPGAASDLVTLDLKMPDLSGPDVWARLSAAGSSAIDRIVFVTGDLVSGDTEDFVKHAGRPVLSKPFDMAQLQTVVIETLRSRSR